MYLGVGLACRGGLERALSYFPTTRLLKLLSQKRAKLRRQSTASSTAQFNFSLSPGWRSNCAKCRDRNFRKERSETRGWLLHA